MRVPALIAHRSRRPLVRGPHAAFVMAGVMAGVMVGDDRPWAPASRVSVSGVSAGQVGMAALASLGLGAGLFLVTGGNGLATLAGLVGGAAIGASLHSETAGA